MRTKMHVPAPRQGLVPRARLTERLAGAAPERLVVVSGPAGFGKTTLLAGWAAASIEAGRLVAWVSLEASERQPASFWAHVVTALDAASPGMGAGVLPLLQAPRPPMRAVLTTLVNELSEVAQDLDLVLDDYHLADGPELADDVAYLLEHLPARVRLVIGTRADPALPLARLRARGELVEVRAADLRFTADEVTAYLDGVVGLDLDATAIATLVDRTEGWAAALQLAALSLQGREDAASRVAGFAGDNRYVVDYLVEEVLGRQTAAIRRFLLDTSVLDRLTGALCDAVTGGVDGRAVLESLERANLFVVGLDDRRYWYRYHHLFAEVLRAHLLEERPEANAALHRRAAEWYATAGEPVPAVRHALQAGDVELAADLIERSVISLLRQRQEVTVHGWVDQIPYDVVRRRPVLAVGFIGALMSHGDVETAATRLDDLERLMTDPVAGTSVLEESEWLRVPGAMETYRAALALVAGDLAGTAVHADRAVTRAAPGDDLTVAAASALAGLASWASGDLEAAHRGYSAAVRGLERAGNISDVLGCSITLGDLSSTQGRLGQARRTYEDALALAAAHEVDGPLRGTADMVLGLSQVAFERDDLATTREYLRRVTALGEHLGLPQHPYRWRVARARLSQADGDLAGAVALLEEAEQVYVADYAPDVRPVASQRARVLITQGRTDEAIAWARERHLAPDDDLSYAREHEHLTLARILMERNDPGPAHALLDRLRSAAQEAGRTATLIEVLVLQSLVTAGRGGEGPAALVLLEQALRHAEPEGHVRVFVSEGRPLADLVEALVDREPTWVFARRVLGAFGHQTAAPAGPTLVDPLSPREVDVLQLLGTDLDGPEIARRLYITLNTLRTHTKSIYAKLGVTSRRAAVTRATELGLL